MNFAVLTILLLVSVNVECIQQGDFISITEAPYYASLVDKDRDSACGAAIISEYWLVSAGHCVKRGYKSLKVRTGATLNYSNGTIHTIQRVVTPKNYAFHYSNFTRMVVHVNDISLIKLKQPIKFNEYKQPIKLRSTPAKENDTVIIVGLGFERVKILNNPPALKKTTQTVASTAPPFVPKPESVFHLQNSTEHLCPGDSGSPGVIDNELAGIAVFVDEKCMDWSDFEDSISLKRNEMKVDVSHDHIDPNWIPTMTIVTDKYSLACLGDSGEPIVRDNKLVGILSMGDICGLWNQRHYTKVNLITPIHKYYDWIIQTTGISYL